MGGRQFQKRRHTLRRKQIQEKIMESNMGTDRTAWEKIAKICDEIKKENQKQPEDNLEYDLINSQYITDKTEDDVYAQNLYAALCNNWFYKGDMKEPWTCSWRYAGGIVADMKWLATGKAYDYLDLYCSAALSDNPQFLHEGVVSDEIRNDLLKLGWRIEEYEDITIHSE